MGRKSGLYAPLGEYLTEKYGNHGIKEVVMTFEEIDELLEASHHKLPGSAYKHRAWWSNSETSQQAQEGWLGAGYEVVALHKTDDEYDKVAFRIRSGNKVYISNTSSYHEEKKECISCHKTIDKDFVFCPYCGKPQIKKCPDCGTILKEDFNFCPKCGKSRDDMEKA